MQGDLRESELTIDTAESATRHAALQQTTPPPGVFPLDALNDTMRAIAEETAAVYGLPPQLTAMAAVATFAGELGNAFRLKGAVNGRESNANVYVIAACPKSFGKGAAASVAEPLIERSAEIESEFEREVRPGLKVEKAILEAQLKKLLAACRT